MSLEQRIEKIEEKLEQIVQKFNSLDKKKTPVTKQSPKNIPFEEAFEKCKGGKNYPCMYLPKSGKNKDHCCGIDAIFVENEEDEQIKLEGKIKEDYFHSLRCNSCKEKGRTANSISKKKCEQKIKGIDVDSTGKVDESALSFLSGETKEFPSPSQAMANKSLSGGLEIKHSNYYHFIVPFNDNNFVFEVSKNKSGTPCRKKTPTLRGYIPKKEVEEDSYEEEMEEKIPEKIIKELAKVKKFIFEDSNIIKEQKKKPVIPTVSKDEEDEDSESDLKESEMDEILNGL